MNTPAPEQQHASFAIGLFAGTLVGAVLVMWLAPKSTSELRDRMTDSARTLRRRASERYQEASTRVGDTVDSVTRTGQNLRDDVAGAVARGAHEVERFATASKTDRSDTTIGERRAG